MTKEQRQIVRNQIQDHLLIKLLKLAQDPDVDPKEFKQHYDFKLAEQDHELAERKLNGVEEKRGFSADETIEGIDAMLGKGEAQ